MSTGRSLQPEKVLAKDSVGDRVYYLIQWVGMSRGDSTWESVENLSGYKPMIRRFEKYNESPPTISDLPSLPSYLKSLKGQSSSSISKNSAADLTQSSSMDVVSHTSPQDSKSEGSSVSRRKGPLVDQNLKRRINTIIQPFEDEFMVMFATLRKKLKEEFNIYNERPVTQVIEVGCQTDIPLQVQHISRLIPAVEADLRPKKLPRKPPTNRALLNELRQAESSDKKRRSSEKKRKVAARTTIEDKKLDILEKKFHSPVQPTPIEQRTPLLEAAKAITHLGSFEKGNEIDHIVKGMFDRSDGIRKYLIRWKQDGNQDVHESWVQEEVMKEFACKELARFFLSRIRWTKS